MRWSDIPWAPPARTLRQFAGLWLGVFLAQAPAGFLTDRVKQRVLLLAGSSAKLSAAIGADPVGALTTLLPTWFLVPFAVVAVLGLVGGSVLDIYSSGLALLTLGLRTPRYVAALIDGTVMVLGTIYVVFIAKNFLIQFEGFLITLGVPIAAWCGVMLAELTPEHGGQGDLFDARDPRRQQLMHTLDGLNRRLGRDTVFYGAAGVRREWKAVAKKKSGHFTTDLRHPRHNQNDHCQLRS